MNKWIRLEDEEPKLERIYLVFSPKFGYQTAVWENKPLHRQGFWDDVTHWMRFYTLTEIVIVGNGDNVPADPALTEGNV